MDMEKLIIEVDGRRYTMEVEKGYEPTEDELMQAVNDYDSNYADDNVKKAQKSYDEGVGGNFLSKQAHGFVSGAMDLPGVKPAVTHLMDLAKTKLGDDEYYNSLPKEERLALASKFYDVASGRGEATSARMAGDITRDAFLFKRLGKPLSRFFPKTTLVDPMWRSVPKAAAVGGAFGEANALSEAASEGRLPTLGENLAYTGIGAVTGGISPVISAGVNKAAAKILPKAKVGKEYVANKMKESLMRGATEYKKFSAEGKKDLLTSIGQMKRTYGGDDSLGSYPSATNERLLSSISDRFPKEAQDFRKSSAFSDPFKAVKDQSVSGARSIGKTVGTPEWVDSTTNFLSKKHQGLSDKIYKSTDMIDVEELSGPQRSLMNTLFSPRDSADGFKVLPRDVYRKIHELSRGVTYDNAYDRYPIIEELSKILKGKGFDTDQLRADFKEVYTAVKGFGEGNGLTKYVDEGALGRAVSDPVRSFNIKAGEFTVDPKLSRIKSDARRAGMIYGVRKALSNSDPASDVLSGAETRYLNGTEQGRNLINSLERLDYLNRVNSVMDSSRGHSKNGVSPAHRVIRTASTLPYSATAASSQGVLGAGELFTRKRNLQRANDMLLFMKQPISKAPVYLNPESVPIIDRMIPWSSMMEGLKSRNNKE